MFSLSFGAANSDVVSNFMFLFDFFIAMRTPLMTLCDPCSSGLAMAMAGLAVAF
jgi:hypothetical protein